MNAVAKMQLAQLIRKASPLITAVVFLGLLGVGAGIVRAFGDSSDAEAPSRAALLLGISLIFVLVLAGHQFLRRSLRIVPLAIMVAALGAVLFVRGRVLVPQFFAGTYIQSWNVYHYYLGAKYFDELGYFDLYKYTFLADRQEDGRLRKVKQTRDLHTYRRVSVAKEIASADRSRFSDARWAEFKSDLVSILEVTRPRIRRLMTVDLGYNATPFGNVIFSWLANTFSVTSRWERIIMLGLDWLVLIPTFFLVGRAFGALRGLFFATSVLLFFGIGANFFGGLFRFHWLCASVVAMCCYRLGHYRTAGFALALAVAERIFPLVLLIGPGVDALKALARSKPLTGGQKRFAGAFVATGFLALVLSVSFGHRAKNWSEFSEAMTTHADYHYTVARKFGTKRIFIHDFAGETTGGGRGVRVGVAKSQETARRVTQGLLLVCSCLCAFAAGTRNRMAFGILFVFALSVVSRYYFVLWFALLLCGPGMFRRRYKQVLFDLCVVGLLPFYFAMRLLTADQQDLFTAANVYAAVSIVFLAGLLVGEKLRIPRVWPLTRGSPKTSALPVGEEA